MTKATAAQANEGSASGVAKLTNVAFALEALNAASQSIEPGAPHIAVLYGAPGLGKTQAALHLAHPAGRDAVFVALRMFETTKTLAQLLCVELGIQAKDRWPVATMYDHIVRRVQALGRPLVFDEVDYVAEKSTIDFIRTIHDNTSVPVFLIGEQDLKRKLLSRHERFHDRVLVWKEALPCDAHDVRKLAAHHVPDLALDDKAITTLLARSGGVARRVYTELKAMQEAARKGVR